MTKKCMDDGVQNRVSVFPHLRYILLFTLDIRLFCFINVKCIKSLLKVLIPFGSFIDSNPFRKSS